MLKEQTEKLQAFVQQQHAQGSVSYHAPANFGLFPNWQQPQMMYPPVQQHPQHFGTMSAAPPTTPSRVHSGSSDASTPSNMSKYCGQCGKPYDGNALFCSFCGTKLMK
jgi:hypothetical protein